MSPNGSQSANQTHTLAVLLAAFALTLGLYYSLRFGGWSMEGDASSQAVAAAGMIKGGALDSTGRYTNGFGYTAQLVLTSFVSGLDVQDIQLGSSLYVFVLALVSFITYREYLDSAMGAGLGVILLFIQPDFLFYAIRGSHEKCVWMYALLMLFLLSKSNQYLSKPLRLVLYIGLFYTVFWSFTSTNVYFAAVFMGAILISLIVGWMVSRFVGKEYGLDDGHTGTLQRMIIISLACGLIVFIFINYTYSPALNTYYYFSDFSDRVSLLLLGSQPLETPTSYQIFGLAWRSQGAYLALTGIQWLITLVSLVVWGSGLFSLHSMDKKQWLLWLMYGAFGGLLLFGLVADYTGFMSTNLQLRMFTPFTLFSSPLAAGLLLAGFRKLHLHWRRLAAAAAVVVMMLGAATVALKVTNDPIFGNQWLFYTPAELAPLTWLENSGVVPHQVWVDTWEHISIADYFWNGFRPLVQDQYRYGRYPANISYTVISQLSLLRANRSGIAMPEVSGQLRLYDDGTSQVYHRRPLTPYQR
jgi:hypothetical protein